jgi:hypothetical protein
MRRMADDAAGVGPLCQVTREAEAEAEAEARSFESVV